MSLPTRFTQTTVTAADLRNFNDAVADLPKVSSILEEAIKIEVVDDKIMFICDIDKVDELYRYQFGDKLELAQYNHEVEFYGWARQHMLRDRIIYTTGMLDTTVGKAAIDSSNALIEWY